MKIPIIMYHYVRDFSLKKNKGYNGLDITKFIQQLDYLQSKYEILDIKLLLDNNFLKKKNNKKFCLLTFDDGYIDHYENVFPILVKRKITGSFYISGGIYEKKKLLNVNKIHYIFSKLSLVEIKKILNDILLEHNLKKQFNLLKKKYKNTSRFDDDYTSLIKFFFQTFLPINIQTTLLDIILEKYLKISQNNLFDKFYLSKENILEMQKYGMYFGGHGHSHQRMALLSKEEKLYEIEQTKKFLKKIHTDTKKWIMCYPYGSFNKSLIDILKKNNCTVALTTIPREAILHDKNLLKLPRLDTNDLII